MRKYRISISFAVTIIVVSVLFSIWGIGENLKIKAQYHRKIEILNQERKKLRTFEENSEQIMLKKAEESNDKILESNASQIRAANNLTKVSTNFFKTAFTFKDTREYLNRRNLVKPYVTEDVLHDQNIFTDGKDTSGHDYIKTTGIQMRFSDLRCYGSTIKDNKITGLVDVTYQARYKGSGYGQATDVWKVVYDLSNKKIESVSKVGTISTSS